MLHAIVCNSYLNMLVPDQLTSPKSNSRNSKSQATSFQDPADPRKRYLIVTKQQRQI
jgi:hypothetical protein